MTSVRELQRKYGFLFKGYLGQNFFNNDILLNEILDKLDITKNDIVIEIGPGFGVLTEKLLLKSKKVISIEIDDRLIPILNENLKEYDNFKLIHNDFMKMNLEDLGNLNGRFKVVANIPYYITTPILEKLFKSELSIDFIAIMVQKEVGNRILANVSTKEYGSLSVFVNYFSVPHVVKYIPAVNFIPKPKVDSVFIKFEILDNRKFENREIEDNFLKFVKRCFSMRRKTLYNVLSNFTKDKEILMKIFNYMDIDFNKRAENLTVDEFVKIFKILNGLD
ncbi:dimethyladenosine transferase [Candidatus Arthromitus sp. SFB-mouse-Japan]|uniref:16S rRNA (adenine(1518)-N(6)/adenine(1519)-N(6))- dimethyltransferase RsmA n=1 Tax=Candidatus Arthromitus sp. SFB-mouse TaxID=49118 RepID=UPI00021B8192|nr:16S rRNA (adenine(1518)-N(6)/adenine(1519)-N(6))-dimethyltransferase RsmA [Candidatus Arthromitus sp. SFB-mouse]EIA24759.1 Ribosomal RNA adenine methylase transferase-like protein [Candidatus Arthromitus sp. SFB-1]EIA28794.1 dimethyladenosine transferase [Candidatus Arthromitus sp. SFB-5]EIA29215.1 dimethyladenosine transferase [Candidatus Arthromitus sp. SFB-co]EIA29712.1 dimethyladenosine transferase [Candidatus Arthromitus sp. SFB-mouse-SU]EGX28099.1 dimethyladenosine transferase [Candid